MTRFFAVIALVVMLAGCAPTDLGLGMGLTDGTPVVEPLKLDCDLIFPPASINP